MSAPPIFLIGPGDGMKAAAELLDAHPTLFCSEGGPFVSALVRFVKRGNEGSAYTEEDWLSSLAAFFAAAQRGRMEVSGKHRWAEASGQELSLDLLDRLFPDAQIVHVLPRGWAADADEHTPTTDEARFALAAERSGAALKPNRYHAVFLDEMDAAPLKARDEILEFLGELGLDLTEPGFVREVVVPEPVDLRSP